MIKKIQFQNTMDWGGGGGRIGKTIGSNIKNERKLEPRPYKRVLTKNKSLDSLGKS